MKKVEKKGKGLLCSARRFFALRAMAQATDNVVNGLSAVKGYGRPILTTAAVHCSPHRPIMRP